MVEIIKWFYENYAEILIAVQAIVGALIAISLMIPGEQPEKFLQGVLEVLKKISRK